LFASTAVALSHPTNATGGCYTPFGPSSPDYLIDSNVGDRSTGCALISGYYVYYNAPVSGPIKNITIQTEQENGYMHVDFKAATSGGWWTASPAKETTGYPRWTISTYTDYVINSNLSDFNINGTLYFRVTSDASNVGGNRYGQMMYDLAYDIAYYQPPTAPQNLSESHGLDSASLQWNSSFADTNTTVIYSITENGAFLGNTTDIGYNITGLSQATGYNFSVTATDGYGLSSQSSTVSLRTEKAPDPPQQQAPAPAPPPVYSSGGGGGVVGFIGESIAPAPVQETEVLPVSVVIVSPKDGVNLDSTLQIVATVNGTDPRCMVNLDGNLYDMAIGNETVKKSFLNMASGDHQATVTCKNQNSAMSKSVSFSSGSVVKETPPQITAAATSSDGNVYYGLASAVLAVLAVFYKRIRSRIFPQGAQKRRQNMESPPRRPLRQISSEYGESEDASSQEEPESDLYP